MKIEWHMAERERHAHLPGVFGAFAKIKPTRDLSPGWNVFIPVPGIGDGNPGMWFGALADAQCYVEGLVGT